MRIILNPPPTYLNSGKSLIIVHIRGCSRGGLAERQHHGSMGGVYDSMGGVSVCMAVAARQTERECVCRRTSERMCACMYTQTSGQDVEAMAVGQSPGPSQNGWLCGESRLYDGMHARVESRLSV